MSEPIYYLRSREYRVVTLDRRSHSHGAVLVQTLGITTLYNLYLVRVRSSPSRLTFINPLDVFLDLGK